MIIVGALLIVLAVLLAFMFGAVGVFGGILLIVFGDMFLVAFCVLKLIGSLVGGKKHKEEA